MNEKNIHTLDEHAGIKASSAREMQQVSAQKAKNALEALSTLLQVTKEQEEKNKFYQEKYILGLVSEDNKNAFSFKDEDLHFFILNCSFFIENGFMAKTFLYNFSNEKQIQFLS